MNVNTREYWENRFSSGDWESRAGRRQTADFAVSQLPHLKFDRSFAGTIADFGCGLGDSIPILSENFPKAKLIGIDISESAIEQCRRTYGHLATFTRGEARDVPEVDVIIASNVFEHLSEDREIAALLLVRCRELYVFVPYKESPLCREHVNCYDEYYFKDVAPYSHEVFLSKGWSFFGLRKYYQIHLKNIARRLMGRPILQQPRQILFHFPGRLAPRG